MSQYLSILLLAAFVLSFYQNCGELKSSNGEVQSQSLEGEATYPDLTNLDCRATDCGPIIEKNNSLCFFNGVAVPLGQTIKAYISPMGAQCEVETRTCGNNNRLSGSYQYLKCDTDQELANRNRGCLFNGQVVDHGQDITAYLNSTPGANGQCESQTRSCVDGTLSGNFRYGQCAVGKKACLFNGVTYKDGEYVRAFTRDVSGSCQSQFRVCQDGVLTGQYAKASCLDNTPRACVHNGKTYLDGQSFTAYNSYDISLGTCPQAQRTCIDGVLTGTFQFESCIPPQQNAGCTINGINLASGESIKTFKRSVVVSDVRSSFCLETERTCRDGILMGDSSYSLYSCEADEPNACEAFGKSVRHGQIVKSFSIQEEAGGQTCAMSEQESTCSNGSLDLPLLAFDKCQVSEDSCDFNGQQIESRLSTDFYKNDVVDLNVNINGCGKDNMLRVYCKDGALFQKNLQYDPANPSSKPLIAFANLTFDPYAYNKRSCSLVGADCQYQNRTYKTGDHQMFYKRNSIPYAESNSCTDAAIENSVSGRCWNGQFLKADLSGPIDVGLYSYTSCSVLASDCTRNGVTYGHNRNIGHFYKSNQVPFVILSDSGADVSCSQNDNRRQARCVDGQISDTVREMVDGQLVYVPFDFATYSFDSCETMGANQCALGGVNVDHTTIRSRYKMSSVPYVASAVASCTDNQNWIRAVCTNGQWDEVRATALSSPALVNVDMALYPETTCSVTGRMCSFDGYEFNHGVSINPRLANGTRGTDNGGYIYKYDTRPYSLTDNLCRDNGNAVGNVVCTDGSLTVNGLPVPNMNDYPHINCVVQTSDCTVNGEVKSHGAFFRVYKSDSVTSPIIGDGYGCSADGNFVDVRCLDGKVYTQTRPYTELDISTYPYNRCTNLN